LKKLDFYIIRKFLGTYFFILILIMAISVVFDASEKVDDFAKFHAPLNAILFDYYLNFVIYFSNSFSFLIIFISVIFFTSKLAKNNEIVAVLCSGVSFNRLLLPFFISATVLASLSVYLNHFIIPDANKSRLAFEERYTRNPIRFEKINREMEPGLIVYFNLNLKDEYNKNFLDGFLMRKWENNELKSSLYAQRAYNDTVSNNWHLELFVIRYIGKFGDSIIHGQKMDTILSFKANELGYRDNYASAMNYSELNEYIEREKAKGSADVVNYEIEKHSRTAYPMATYILTLIAVCVAGRKVRGGLGMHLAIGLLIAACYIFSMKITTVAAAKAGMDPSLAVWLPNMIFLIICIPVYRNAQK